MWNTSLTFSQQKNGMKNDLTPPYRKQHSNTNELKKNAAAFSRNKKTFFLRWGKKVAIKKSQQSKCFYLPRS
jgi:hypothetical protein